MDKESAKNCALFFIAFLGCNLLAQIALTN